MPARVSCSEIELEMWRSIKESIQDLIYSIDQSNTGRYYRIRSCIVLDIYERRLVQILESRGEALICAKPSEK